MKDSINTLLVEIEQKIQRGSGSNWSTRDFESLSEEIFKETEQRLSVTTLKRIWGRTQASNNPSIATLDILSSFAGHRDWRNFQEKQKNPSRGSKKMSAVLPFLILLAICLAGISWYLNRPQALEEPRSDHQVSSEVQFAYEKVTTGYPNTVVFQYDIGDLPYDSIYIQQSWDKTKRIDLSEPKGLVTATYYYPGYFSTKLVVDDQILMEKDLYIPTDGWQGILVGPNGPYRYLGPESLQRGKTLSIDDKILDELNNHPPFGIALNHLKRKPILNSDGFNLEAKFRLAQPTDLTLCKYFAITIIGSKEVLNIAFSDKGCVGDLTLMLNGEMISGRDNDLTPFGVEAGGWVDFRLELGAQQIRILLDNEEVFFHSLDSDIGLIGGIKCFFEGLPEIEKMMLRDQEQELDLLAPEKPS